VLGRPRRVGKKMSHSHKIDKRLNPYFGSAVFLVLVMAPSRPKQLTEAGPVVSMSAADS
jgi:hypothetical protein